MDAGSGVARLVRGARTRGAASVITLLVAVVTVAAAAAGPVFYTAAQHAVLTEALHAAPVVGQGLEVTAQVPPAALDRVTSDVEAARAATPAAGLLSTRIRGQELGFVSAEGQSGVVAWRDGLCAHLRVVTGRCPRASGEAAVSRSTAELDGVRPGAKLRADVPLTVVGVYEPLAPGDRYWFNRGYFPQEGVQSIVKEAVDAVFTDPATFASAPNGVYGVTVVDYLLDLDRVAPDQVPALRATTSRLRDRLGAGEALSLTSGIEDVLDDAEQGWSSLRVPVALVTAQLLVPVWILLFLSIGDAAQARAPEVGLARLRGHSRARTLRFAVAEPLALLAVALPAGIVLGWVAAGLLGRAALRPGTPVALPPLAVLAGVLALSAGVVAAAVTGYRTMRRPVVEQWRRTRSGATRRGWLVDVAVLVATAAAVVELYGAGIVGSRSVNVLALLVPGLVGLCVAVLTARALPWACRRAFRRTARRGGLGAFLAVRQVARRPAGLRTVMMLVTAFALATFSVSAWLVTRANTADVAATWTGAATVLDVLPAPGEDLTATLARVDPAARSAAVQVFSDYGDADHRTLAVDPERFARVAFWRDDFGARPLAALLPALHPPAADPIGVTGDRIRVHLADLTVPEALDVHAGLRLPTGLAETPVDLGTLPVTDAPGRTVTLEAALPPCPCTLRSLSVDRADHEPDPTAGSVTVTSIEVRDGGRWAPLAAGLTRATGGWQWNTAGTGAATGSASAAPGGLQLSWQSPGGVAQLAWGANAWPSPLPALVSGDVDTRWRQGGRNVAGLDGAPLPIRPVATVTVPGAPSGGVIVDLTYARRAAFDASITSRHQVWLAADAPASLPDRLRAAGVRIVGRETAAQEESLLRRQGPALAPVLFVADALTATALACVGAVTALHLAARRRRYELSSLVAAGCPPSSLHRSLWLEQVLVLGTGLLSGVAAGVAAVRLALPGVPEFVTRPDTPALRYDPPWNLLAGVLGVLVALVVVVALAGASALMSGVRPERLREGSA